MKGRRISERDDESQRQQWAAMVGLGFEFVAAVLLMTGAGYLLDGWLGTGPWLLVGGSMLGFGVGLFILVRTGMRSFHD